MLCLAIECECASLIRLPLRPVRLLRAVSTTAAHFEPFAMRAIMITNQLTYGLAIGRIGNSKKTGEIN